jgi:ribosomal protein L32
MSTVLFFHNPGIGDNAWVRKDREMIALLNNCLNDGEWILSHRPFGPPCGGYYYKLEIFAANASEQSLLVKMLEELGIHQSKIAEMHFD